MSFCCKDCAWKWTLSASNPVIFSEDEQTREIGREDNSKEDRKYPVSLALEDGECRCTNEVHGMANAALAKTFCAAILRN